ncbi:hypothetical protein OSB04_005476 [Centaurea solstitialis]|uniref:Uncharacterized protein n=1 Tax=Centaurea solstitialis TaxID=347529 RepID=A0AA38WS47_9ASTR|nr:hypothetical protein OSB04_005476 [Centaurea solstitialis]
MELLFKSSDVNLWKEALSAYETTIESMNKPDLISLDNFYCKELPPLLHQRNPNPHITTPELSKLMQWKLTRGKWRPRLLDFVSSLDEEVVKTASEKAFTSLPDVSKAISELTVLKGVGPATASAILAAYAPHLAPFMSDEAMVAALGNSKQYTLKQYLLFVDKLEAKAKVSLFSNLSRAWLPLFRYISMIIQMNLRNPVLCNIQTEWPLVALSTILMFAMKDAFLAELSSMYRRRIV